MKGYKGFDKDWKCRDKQYEVGKTMDKRKINISTKDVLKVLPMQPLFGNRRGKSIFLVFMKS